MKNGAIVQSVMKLTNVKEDGTQREKMYKIQYGEDGRDIYVSGSHLVWDPLDEKFLPVEEYAKAFKSWLYSLLKREAVIKLPSVIVLCLV